MTIRRCVCPGSYHPVTTGHLDIVRRAAGLFDEVNVAVLGNPAKAAAQAGSGYFTLDERADLLRRALAGPDGVPGARVAAVTDGLLVDYCRQVGAIAIVKGLRGVIDYGYEQPMALMNRHLSGIDTVFLTGDPRWEHVSSSLVREVASHGGDLAGLVPDAVRAEVAARFARG